MRTEELSTKICGQIIKAEAAKIEDWEVLHYGIYKIITIIQQLGVLLIAGLVLGTLSEIIIFTVCYSLLRRYIGGTHAKNHRSCLTIFTAIATLIPLLCLYCPLHMILPLIICLITCALILVLIKAPAVHPNSPRSAKSIKRFRTMSLRIALTEFILILLLNILVPITYRYLLLCGACGYWVAAITLIFPMPKQERGDQ